MNAPQKFLVVMLIIFSLPYLFWRLGRTEHFAQLVVVQIITGIMLGPGVMGAWFPDAYRAVFDAPTITSVNAIAQWAVMVFIWIAGLELDLKQAWAHRREGIVTAGLALGVPLASGAVVAALLLQTVGWIGVGAMRWQFIAGIGMACAVTALPVLILILDKVRILRTPIGQRILRYASLDDIAIWGVLALILMDWRRTALQIGFLLAFALASAALRRLMPRLGERDRWYAGLIWLVACGLGADASGLHYMVGAFIAGATLDLRWFDTAQVDRTRHDVLLFLMPVFFLSMGLRTNWQAGGYAVVLAAAALLLASVGGKLLGTAIAGRLLRWGPGDAWLIGWLLQTKALVMIGFASVLLDKSIITGDAFTALLLMAVASTMLTPPMIAPRLARLPQAAPEAG